MTGQLFHNLRILPPSLKVSRAFSVDSRIIFDIELEGEINRNLNFKLADYF